MQDKLFAILLLLGISNLMTFAITKIVLRFKQSKYPPLEINPELLTLDNKVYSEKLLTALILRERIDFNRIEDLYDNDLEFRSKYPLDIYLLTIINHLHISYNDALVLKAIKNSNINTSDTLYLVESLSTLSKLNDLQKSHLQSFFQTQIFNQKE